MYYTYVLLCKNNQRQKVYIGFTEDLELRLREHKWKKVRTTKMCDVVELVYYEACRNKTDARKRELQLKTGFGRGYLKKRIQNDAGMV